MINPHFVEFKKPVAGDWEKKAMAELKGKSFDETLTWLIAEGVRVDAYHETYIMTDDERRAIQQTQRETTGWHSVSETQRSVFESDIQQSIVQFSQSANIINDLTSTLKEIQRLFSEKNVSDNGKLPLIIKFPVGTNYFLPIAALRAIRFLIVRLSAVYSIDVDLKTWVTTDKLAYKQDNPHINIVRATTMAMAGIIGGCDYLTVEPFDESGSEFSGRIARNVSILLEEEAFVGKVADPAAGSFFIENLTYYLITETWKNFAA